MMVIEHTNVDGDKTIFPADRCTWRQVDNTGSGYAIEDVRFYPGNAVANNLSGANLSNMLGFIGKSGRFVAISL